MGIASDSFRTYIFRIATMVMSLGMGIMTARFLGPAGKGIFSLALLINSFYATAFGNLNGAMTYQISRLRESPRRVFVTASFYGWGIGLLTIASFWVYTILVPDFKPGYLWLVVLNTPFTLAVSTLSGTFLGMNKVSSVNWQGFFSGFILLLLFAIGYFGFKMDVNTTLVCWLISQVLVVLGGLWVSRPLFLPLSKDSFHPGLLKKMLGFGWQLGLINLVTFLNYRVDMFLVTKFLGTKNLGFYSIAVSGAEFLWFTSSAIGTAIYARIGMAEEGQAGLLTARAVRHTLLINILLGLGIWGAFEFLLPIVYGEIYRPSLVPFRILLPGVLAYGLAGIFSTYFANQLGKPKFSLLISFISMTINIIISFILIPKIGMAGGAWATTISYLFSITLLIVIFCRKTHLRWSDLFLISKADLADYQLLGQNLLDYFRRKYR